MIGLMGSIWVLAILTYLDHASLPASTPLEKYEKPIVVTSSHMFHSSAYNPHYETSVALWDDEG
jgi:hypothetical protein